MGTFVQNVLGKVCRDFDRLRCKGACVAGYDGQIYASSPDIQITPAEMSSIVKWTPGSYAFSGCGGYLAGKKYVFVTEDDDGCIFKQGNDGYIFSKTPKLIIIGTYGDAGDRKVEPGQARHAVGKLVDYLKGAGY